MILARYDAALFEQLQPQGRFSPEELALAEEGVTSGRPAAYRPPVAPYHTEGAAISEAEVAISSAEVAISRAEIGEVVRRMARRLIEQEEG